eukprot:1995223-Pyramimonas_sp.AAC.1
MQRDSFTTQATDGLKAGTIPPLELYRPGSQAAQRAAANSLAAAVLGSARSSFLTLRWALRSPCRVAGMLVLCFVLWEALKYLEVIELVGTMVLAVWGWVVAFKDAFVESPETVREWVVYSG